MLRKVRKGDLLAHPELAQLWTELVGRQDTPDRFRAAFGDCSQVVFTITEFLARNFSATETKFGVNAASGTLI